VSQGLQVVVHDYLGTKKMPNYSLIIPIHNTCSHLEAVLTPLRSLSMEWEIVLVDDGSIDGSAEVAQELLPRAHFIRLESSHGPAYARNEGAWVSSGGLLVFQDSDVVAQVEALQGLVSELERQPEFGAIFGAYDDSPASPRPVSRFRNLLHHFVHCSCAGPVPSFWSGFGAIRREGFEAVGGFDQKHFVRPSVEDIELGARLWKAGYRTKLNPRWQVNHRKDWTLAEATRTDIHQRARPWARLILEGSAVSGNLNLKTSFLRPIFLLALFLTFGIGALWLGEGFVGLAALSGGLYLASNWAVYRFFARHGLAFASVLFLALHHGCALVGGALAVVDWLRARILVQSYDLPNFEVTTRLDYQQAVAQRNDEIEESGHYHEDFYRFREESTEIG